MKYGNTVIERTIVDTPYWVPLSEGTVTGTKLDVATLFWPAVCVFVAVRRRYVSATSTYVPAWVIWPCSYRSSEYGAKSTAQKIYYPLYIWNVDWFQLFANQ